nr:hypothetical protein [Tanacetum cinerariifolium]
MIDDAFKKSVGYKYYRAKKTKSKKAKADEEPEEQHDSLVRGGREKDEAAHHNSSSPANTTSYPTTNSQHISLQAKAKKLMQKKLEALTSINVSKAINKAVHVKVLIKMKKLIPTHVPKVLANYVKPCLNNYVLEVMRNNQINLFTKPSTSADDLSNMDLKLKLMNIIHLNKSNTTHPTNKKLYDTIYESIIIDQEALDDQNAHPSFHKRSHDHQDPPTDREGEKRKKR